MKTGLDGPISAYAGSGAFADMPMPILDRIDIYPIKSLDGVSVPETTVLPGGALAQDREFALINAEGKVVNAKRTAAIHQIRAAFDLAERQVTLWSEADPRRETFHLEGDRPTLETWFSDFFGEPMTLHQNTHQGFPDDTVAAGPTVVSQATLTTVATWFPGSALDTIRRRFRANLELGDAPAFWEDQLLGDTEALRSFQIGAVRLQGHYSCQRCIVPTRDPQTGDRLIDFQKHFSAQREATLPPWAPRPRFNHFYRLTTNTSIPASEVGKVLRVGDRVQTGVA